MYKAYLDGRTSTDPSLGWYQGELVRTHDINVLPTLPPFTHTNILCFLSSPNKIGLF